MNCESLGDPIEFSFLLDDRYVFGCHEGRQTKRKLLDLRLGR
jgi:hypothetical protein